MPVPNVLRFSQGIVDINLKKKYIHLNKIKINFIDWLMLYVPKPVNEIWASPD